MFSLGAPDKTCPSIYTAVWANSNKVSLVYISGKLNVIFRVRQTVSQAEYSSLMCH